MTGTGHTGIEAGNGNITLNGTVNVNAAQAAIYSPKGSISVNGDLTAETTNGKYFCVVGNNGVTLTGGTVSISSKAIAVRTAGDIELSGNITVSSADSAAVNTLDGGNILIKNGSTIKATGKYGLYAAGGITVEGGTVKHREAATPYIPIPEPLRFILRLRLQRPTAAESAERPLSAPMVRPQRRS